MPADPEHSRFRGVRLGDCLAGRNNNFDVLRLLAAWSVLVSHSHALVDRPEPLSQFNTSLGQVGVLIFFAVSGLLIRRSWEYDPSPRDFWIKRFLRLWPALTVVALVTAFVIGPAVTYDTLGTYFSSWRTWLYPVRIVVMLPFGADLPGVFPNDSLHSAAVNGPLWSLPIEVLAYIFLFALGISGLLAKRGTATAVAVASLVWASWWVTVTGPAVAATHVLSAFAVGAAAYSWRDRLVLSHPIALIAGLACVAAAYSPDPLRVVVWILGAVYLCYWFAYALPPLGRILTRWGDASYGLYIWAFPIQRTIIQIMGRDTHPWMVILIATPIVWLLAQASWHLIERPALAHKPAAKGARSSSQPSTENAR